MTHDAGERAGLCDLLEELGPDAPTLCEGWATLDMAAHLVIRERDPRAGLVIMGGDRFAGLESRLMGRARDRGLAALVARLRAGPPPIPWRLPGLRQALNLNEWFVHHEDVRRPAGGEPRTLAPGLETALWAGIARASRGMVRGVSGLGIEVVAPGLGTRRLRQGTPGVTLTGAPGELVLYLNGRREAAQVEVSGTDEALARFSRARLGL